MRNEFMVRASSGLHALKVAQGRHARLKARADARLKSAQVRHATEVEEAARVEAGAWRALLEVPGMSVTTAAALCETSEATVHRFVARTTTRPSVNGKRAN